MKHGKPIQYRSRKRKKTYQRYWNQLVTVYGGTCYYCDEIASVIDHLLPVSAGGSNDFTNLVPSCTLCNLIAGSKVFKTEDEKRRHILKRRKKKQKLTRTICTECLLPFEYRRHSPSLLLCAECYDREYDTTLAQTKKWQRWLDLMQTAEMPVEELRAVGDVYRREGGISIEARYRTLWTMLDEQEKKELHKVL